MELTLNQFTILFSLVTKEKNSDVPDLVKACHLTNKNDYCTQKHDIYYDSLFNKTQQDTVALKINLLITD